MFQACPCLQAAMFQFQVSNPRQQRKISEPRHTMKLNLNEHLIIYSVQSKFKVYCIVLIRLEPSMWPLWPIIFMPVVPFIYFIAVGMVRHNNAVKNGTFIKRQNFKQTHLKRQTFPCRPQGRGVQPFKSEKEWEYTFFFKLSLCINSTFSLLSQIRGKIHTHHIRKGVRVPFPASFASTVPFLCHLRCKELWKPSYQERDGGTFW